MCVTLSSTCNTLTGDRACMYKLYSVGGSGVSLMQTNLFTALEALADFLWT